MRDGAVDLPCRDLCGVKALQDRVQFCDALFWRLESCRQFFLYLNLIFLGEESKYRIHLAAHFTQGQDPLIMYLRICKP